MIALFFNKVLSLTVTSLAKSKNDKTRMIIESLRKEYKQIALLDTYPANKSKSVLSKAISFSFLVESFSFAAPFIK